MRTKWLPSLLYAGGLLIPSTSAIAVIPQDITAAPMQTHNLVARKDAPFCLKYPIHSFCTEGLAVTLDIDGKQKFLKLDTVTTVSTVSKGGKKTTIPVTSTISQIISTVTQTVIPSSGVVAEPVTALAVAPAILPVLRAVLKGYVDKKKGSELSAIVTASELQTLAPKLTSALRVAGITISMPTAIDLLVGVTIVDVVAISWYNLKSSLQIGHIPGYANQVHNDQKDTPKKTKKTKSPTPTTTTQSSSSSVCNKCACFKTYVPTSIKVTRIKLPKPTATPRSTSKKPQPTGMNVCGNDRKLFPDVRLFKPIRWAHYKTYLSDQITTYCLETFERYGSNATKKAASDTTDLVKNGVRYEWVVKGIKSDHNEFVLPALAEYASAYVFLPPNSECKPKSRPTRESCEAAFNKILKRCPSIKAGDKYPPIDKTEDMYYGGIQYDDCYQYTLASQYWPSMWGYGKDRQKFGIPEVFKGTEVYWDTCRDEQWKTQNFKENPKKCIRVNKGNTLRRDEDEKESVVKSMVGQLLARWLF